MGVWCKSAGKLSGCCVMRYVFVMLMVFVCEIKWWQVKLFPNFTSIPFDYLLTSWVTNYISNLGFLTCLSWIVSIKNSTLKCLNLKFAPKLRSNSSPMILAYKGQVALEDNFRFVQDKSDLKSASDKKFVRKATVAVENKICEQNITPCCKRHAISREAAFTHCFNPQTATQGISKCFHEEF